MKGKKNNRMAPKEERRPKRLWRGQQCRTKSGSYGDREKGSNSEEYIQRKSDMMNHMRKN
jgi:hypothetical protein